MFLSEPISAPVQCSLSFDFGRINFMIWLAMNQYDRGNGCASSIEGTKSNFGT